MKKLVILFLVFSVFLSGCEHHSKMEGVLPSPRSKPCYTDDRESVKIFEHENYPVAEITKPVPVPVLMYHAFTNADTDAQSTFVNSAVFEAQISALKGAGYVTVTPFQLYNFIRGEAGLPEKPIIITMDDGYASNLEIAAPILHKYGMNATVFVIGSTVGQKYYQNSNIELSPPRFSYSQAVEWVENGTLVIQSHSFNMHENRDGARHGILPVEGESDEQYIFALRNDARMAKESLKSGINEELIAFSYPFGYQTETAGRVWAEAGAKIQFTSDYGCTVVRPDPELEYLPMMRYSIGNEVAPAVLIDTLRVLTH